MKSIDLGNYAKEMFFEPAAVTFKSNGITYVVIGIIQTSYQTTF